jgi:hypothetical protein
VLDASRDDVEVPRNELDGFAILDLDPKSTLPAQEELVLVVVVPRELALDRGDADHGVVHDDEVERLEGANPALRRGGDRDRPAAPVVVHVTLPSTRTGLADPDPAGRPASGNGAEPVPFLTNRSGLRWFGFGIEGERARRWTGHRRRGSHEDRRKREP